MKKKWKKMKETECWQIVQHGIATTTSVDATRLSYKAREILSLFIPMI
jgi:hypothetical protein